jgi:very-long-chain (3R)-3-hydroxyacyl-CoA dehydratase
VLARLAVLVLIIDYSPAAQASLVLALCLAAWALVEPPRYSYYLVKLLQVQPLYLHTWLRYSLFIVLYPLGIVGEFGCLVHALPGASQLYLALPNRFNVVYSHQLLLAGLAVLYLPGAPTMVMHMWRERAKQLGPGKPKTP